MIREKCLICGMDLMWVPSDRPDKGDYYHIFSTDYNLKHYNYLHRPVPALEDPSLIDGSEVPREGSCRIGGERSGLKVEPRASVAPKDGMSYRVIESKYKEISDVRMVSHFMKAIFEAR